MSSNSPNHTKNQRNWVKKNPDYAKSWNKANPTYHKDYLVKWEKKNQEKVKQYRKNRWNKKDEFLTKLKSKPCFDCGNLYPPFAMHFDHRDPKLKVKSISNMMSRSESEILKEVSKCDLVCANCHAVRTYKGIHEGKIKVFGRYL